MKNIKYILFFIVFVVKIPMLKAQLTKIDSIIQEYNGIYVSKLNYDESRILHQAIKLGKKVYVISDAVDSAEAMWYNLLLEDTTIDLAIAQNNLPFNLIDFVNSSETKVTDSNLSMRFLSTSLDIPNQKILVKLLYHLLPKRDFKSLDSIFFDGIRSAYKQVTEYTDYEENTDKKETSNYINLDNNTYLSMYDLRVLQEYYDTCSDRINAIYGVHAPKIKCIMAWISKDKYDFKMEPLHFKTEREKNCVLQLFAEQEDVFAVIDTDLDVLASKKLPNVQNYQCATLNERITAENAKLKIASVLDLGVLNEVISELDDFYETLGTEGSIIDPPSNTFFTQEQQIKSIGNLLETNYMDYFQFIDSFDAEEIVDFRTSYSKELGKKGIEGIKKEIYEPEIIFGMDYMYLNIWSKNSNSQLKRTPLQGLQISMAQDDGTAIILGYTQGSYNNLRLHQYQYESLKGGKINSWLSCYLSIPIYFNSVSAFTDSNLNIVNREIGSLNASMYKALKLKMLTAGLGLQLWIMPQNPYFSLKISGHYIAKPAWAGKWKDDSGSSYSFSNPWHAQTHLKLTAGINLFD